MEGNLESNFDKKSLTIIYLDKTKLEIVNTETGAKLTFPFPDTLVRDCEVLNREALVEQIQNFIKSQKLVPTAGIIVLSPLVIFTKNFPLTIEKEGGELMQTFINNVPFEYVVTSLFKAEKEQILIAANREFVAAIQESFELSGFTIESISAYFIFGQNTGLDTGLTDVNSKLVASRKDFSRQHTLAFAPMVSSNANTQQIPGHQKPQTDKKRLFMLLGVFGVLIFVLIGVLIWSMQSNTPPPPPPKPKPAKVVPSVSPTETLVAIQEADSATSSADTLDLSIQILTSGQAQEDISLIQSLLRRNGFSNVATAPNSAAGAQSAVLFSSTVDTATQTEIHTILKTVVPDITARQQQNSSFDIIIVLGR